MIAPRKSNEQVGPVDLLMAYPTLRAEDPANTCAYVRSHREEIERQMAENKSDEPQ